MNNYLSTVKQIELEARFNQKLGHRTSKIAVYFEYLPHLDKLQLACKCEKEGIDKAFMCCVEIDRAIINDEHNKRILYQHEEAVLNELLDLYKDRMNELGNEE